MRRNVSRESEKAVVVPDFPRKSVVLSRRSSMLTAAHSG
jgi:hypothetical protein